MTRPAPERPAPAFREDPLPPLLRELEARGPSRLPEPLRSLEAWLEAGAPAPFPAAGTLLEEAWVEEAHERVRQALRARRDTAPPALRDLGRFLEPGARQARDKRALGRQRDADRVVLRIGFRKVRPLAHLSTPDVQALLVRALQLEGLPLALDLGKHPHADLKVAPPLPPGMEGLAEWAEAALKGTPAEPAEALCGRIGARLPAGLALRGLQELPPYATPLAELARAAHWRWRCPAEFRDAARDRTAAFMADAAFLVGKAGKVEGRKQEKQVDLRPLVLAMAWDGEDLAFTTRFTAGEAMNPAKLLGAVLELDPAALVPDLQRTGLEFDEDPRLAQADRYAPKLRNLYEDAVLLTGGSNLRLVDEDDDEPLRLG